MLGAFFDDSGTHERSPVVAMGGLLGTDEQWEEFDRKWKAALAQPAPNKPPIAQFHLYDCRSGSGLFRDYKLVEREYAIGQFRDVILDCGLVTVAAAVDAATWYEIIKDEVADEIGAPLELCFYKCVETTFNIIRTRRPGEPVVFFFDKGTKSRLEMWTKMFCMQQANFPELDAMGFLEVSKHPSLQGADYIANNSYRFADQSFQFGDNAEADPSFHRFMKRELSCGLIFGREQIEEVARRVRTTIAARTF